MLAAITVPMGFTTTPATPVGLMISGRHYDEPTLFEVRRHLSQLADSLVAHLACTASVAEFLVVGLPIDWLMMLTRASCGCAGRLCV